MYSCNSLYVYKCYLIILPIAKIISIINKKMSMKRSWNDTDEEKLKYSDKPIILKKVMQIQRGLDAEIYSFFNLSARWGWVANATTWPI